MHCEHWWDGPLEGINAKSKPVTITLELGGHPLQDVEKLVEMAEDRGASEVRIVWDRLSDLAPTFTIGNRLPLPKNIEYTLVPKPKTKRRQHEGR
jgi:hypothetical protein